MVSEQSREVKDRVLIVEVLRGTLVLNDVNPVLNIDFVCGTDKFVP